MYSTRHKRFLRLDIAIEGNMLLFEDKSSETCESQIIFSGIPFMIVGAKVLNCCHSKDFNKSHKEKRTERQLQVN